MTIIKEVIDGLDTVAKAIENIEKINEAVKEGKNYIEAKHPEIKNDLRLLVRVSTVFLRTHTLRN